jgi:hypothetical protein
VQPFVLHAEVAAVVPLAIEFSLPQFFILLAQTPCHPVVEGRSD